MDGWHRVTHGVDEGSGHGVGMGSHGWMAHVTHAVDEGAGHGTGMDKGARVDETWTRAQVRHRQGCRHGMGMYWCAQL